MFYVPQWSERRRSDLAGLLSSILRAHLHAYDAVFSLALRYLIRHASFTLSYYAQKDVVCGFCSVCKSQFLIWQPINSIHKVFCLRQGISSPISDLTERLLFEDRDPPAIPQESLYEAPPFDEVSVFLGYAIDCSSLCLTVLNLMVDIQVDIQALAHAVELTRQGAVDSLRFAKGDLFQAFQVFLYFFYASIWWFLRHL